MKFAKTLNIEAQAVNGEDCPPDWKNREVLKLRFEAGILYPGAFRDIVTARTLEHFRAKTVAGGSVTIHSRTTKNAHCYSSQTLGGLAI